MKKIIQILCLVGIGLGFFNTANAQCNAQLAYWDFNDCTKGLMIRDGLPPQTAVAGCPSAVTTSISRIELKNSCADRAADNRANCLGGNNLTAWQDGADDAVVITVSYPAGSTGKLSGLSFIQGLHDIAEFNGEPNNPPTLWGIRVVKNGTEIFQEIDKPFVLNAWTLRTFDWSSNAAFNVSGTTTFRIELLGYKPSTTINVGAPHNIWEIDDVKILGGCCTITPSCSLTSGGLTAVTCKNNSTTSVTTDDYIEFKLNPTGTGLGSQYTVSASGGATITPTSATYGVATTFRLQNGSAGGGNKTITIKDKTNTSCSTTVTVTDPGTCSTTPACSISGTVSNITCNNNSTTAVTTDDKIVFQLKVTGTGTGSSYNVSVQGGGTISPTSGTYGSTVTFTMASGTAGGGNKTIVITDATTGTCTISKTISDPGNCSASCSISATVSAITCNDNGTASASGDDKITFTLNATGNGVAANYNVSVQGGGTITPTSGAYGSNVTFTLGAGTAGGGNKTIVITDATTGTCTRTVTITDPGSCSNSCPTTTYHICNSESYRLTAQAGLTNYQWMVDTGTGYTNVSGGNTQIINVSTAGKYKYTAKDGSGCDIELCCPYEITKTTLTATGLASTVCNNNSTTTDPLDDKITFTLNPTGTGLSGTYNVSVQGGGSITPTSASYGVATTFTLSEGSAGGGNKVIIIADEDHPTCTINANITDPGACSCPLTAANISGIACSNNGTTSTTDDRIKFILHPTGPAGGTYTVSVNSGTVSPTTGIYGMPTLFVLNAGSAGGGNKTVTVTDDDYPTCKVTVTVTDPGPCSSCQLNDPLVAYVVCDNKGTATTADDEFILYANPNGLGISATYNASATCSGVACTCSKTNVAYGSPQEICRLPKGFGTATVTVTDASGATCNVVGTVAEGTCGVSCNIAASGLNIVCNGSTYTIYLNPTGTGLSTRYHVTGDYNFAFVPYGAAFAIVVDVPINSGAKTITITDANSAACKLVVNIPNQTCVACVKPTLGATVTTVAGTCTGTTANNDATASLTVTGGDKADIVEGATYGSGPAYNAASNKTVTSGSVSFMGLKHNTQYTIRVWNADNTCFEDKTFTTPTKDCSCTNPVLTDLTDQSICVGGSFTPANVTTSVTNGVSVTYQWYNDNGTANPTTTAISGQQAAALTALPTTAGVYKYRVEATNTADNTCKASKLVTLTIVAPANAGTNGSTSVCDNSTTAINLFDLITGESPGGVWTRTTGTGGTFNAAAGTFTPALGAISSTFTYTVTGTAPCPNETSVATVNITAYRTAGTSGNTAICDNSTTAINLFDLITGESPGGVWTRTTGTGGTFNAAAGTFTPALGATTSTFTYSITGTAPCPNETSVATVNITAYRTAGTNGSTSVCDNSTTAINLFDLITGESPGGVWTRTTGTGGTFNAAAGTFTPALGAISSTFTYTVTGTAPCPNATSVATVNITAYRTAGTSGNTAICDNSTTVINLFDLITGESPGGVWTRTSGTGGTFNAAAGTFTPALGATTSTFKYSITGTAPCPNEESIATVNISAYKTAGTNGNTLICDNSTTVINLFDLITGESTGGVWTRTSGTGGTFNNVAGTFTPALGATTSTFKYSITGTAPCPNEESIATVNISAYKTAGTNGNTSICDNSTTVINLFDLITGESTGGVWTRTLGTGGTFNAAAGTFTPALGATISTFKYSITGTAPCPNEEAIATVNISAYKTAGTSGNTPICDNSTTVINLFDLITGESTGGVWTRTSGTGGTFNNVAGTFTPALGATTSTFKYSITGTAPCPNEEAIATVNISAYKTAGTNGNTLICDNSTTVINLFDLITGESTGGVWTRTSGTGGTFNAAAGTFTPALGATNSTFTYSITGVAPCPNETSVATVNISAYKTAGTDGNTSVCDNSLAVINLFSLIGGESTGGVWTRTSGTGGVFVALTGTFIPAPGATTSTFKYSITGTAPCPNDESIATVNISPYKWAGDAGSLSVCDNSTNTINLSDVIIDEASGGVWTRTGGTGGTFDANAGTFTPALGATTSTFVYTITNPSPCVNSTSVAIIYVRPYKTAGTSGNTSICDNSTAAVNLFDLITGESTGGVWTRTGGTGGTFNAAAGTFVPASGATTSTFKYSITGTAPCPNEESIATVNISAYKTAGTSGNTSICDNSTTVINLFDLITGESTGGVWTRTSGTGGTFNQMAGTFTPALGATTSTFKYSITGTAPCPNEEAIATVNISAYKTAGADGNTSVCDYSATTINLFSLITGEDAGGVWTRVSGTGGTFNAAAGTFVPALGATTSIFAYSFTGIAPCDGDFSIVTVNVTPKPVAAIVPKTNVICANGVLPTFTATPNSGVTYEWYGPLSDTTSSLGTALSSTVASFTPTTAQINYIGIRYFAVIVKTTGAAICSDTAFVQLKVNPKPSVTPSSLAVCENTPGSGLGTFNLSSLNSTVGGSNSVSWFSNKERTTAINAPAAYISATGKAYAKVTILETGCSDTTSVSLTVQGKPVQINTETSCVATSNGSGKIVVTATAPAGGSLEYKLDVAGTYGSAATFNGVTNGNHTVYVRVVGSNCYDSTIVNINCFCTQPTLTVVDPAPVCSPMTVNITSSSVITTNTGVRTNYWKNAALTQPLDATTGPATAVKLSGTYYIKSMLSDSTCYTAKAVEVKINPLPVVKDTSLALCDLGNGKAVFNLLLAESAVKGMTNNLVSWYSNADRTVVIGTPSTYLSSSGKVYVRVTNPTTNCSDTTSVNLIIYAKPNAGVDRVGGTAICNTTATVDLPNAAQGESWSQLGNTPKVVAINANTGVVTGMDAIGTYRFILKNTITGCADTVSVETKNCLKGSIGDLVWKDLNDNGLQDLPTEKGVPNVIVQLLNANTAALLKTDTTDANGIYSFTGLEDGNYKVKIVLSSLPADCQLSTRQDAGGVNDDAIDSDFGPNGESPVVVINTLGTGLAKDNPTIDAALIKTCVQPTWQVTVAPVCSPTSSTYSVSFAVTNQIGVLKVNRGTLSGSNPYTVTGIPNGVNLVITDSLRASCKFINTIVAPDCSCPQITLLTPNATACKGDTLPTLKIFLAGSNTNGVGANWYSASTGGVLLGTGLNFKPSGTIAATMTFYIQLTGTTGACLNQPRTPVTVTALDCNVDLALKKSISTKIAQIGDVLTYTLKVWNQSGSNASGVEVTDSIAVTSQFQSGSFVASRGSATISNSVIKWVIGSIVANGDTVTLTYQVKATQQGLHFNTAEISKINEKDVDSTPGNGKDDEDDIDRQCFTVPVKLCATEKIQASVPAKYLNVRWFKDGGNTPIASGNTVLLTGEGTYTFTATNNVCPAGGCCPIIVEPAANCCPEDLCVPFTIKQTKKAGKVVR